ncbi:EamA-like transporter family protein [Roseovarius albus]|uniref:EamA-like transporter family protein n=1 Tax=Roseovarius albus TaxID=1247867 RepID=A0A1X6YQM9_9RHOB|nr:DMT family transporter [Roseovarius albus]SLN28482.1 EamA-like transporter family protein [Roseovarius albus]
MRLFLLTALTMLAFAANSVLNRMALAEDAIDAVSFGAVRLLAGAVMLAILCFALRDGLALRGPGRALGVVSLLLYIFGFSLAYDSLDAGLGALVLFGVVQITMFAGALVLRELVPPRRWLGAGLAFAGLAWLLWPGSGAEISPMHGGLMALAGFGWGLYSLNGRRGGDALQATAANFIWATPVGVVLMLVTQGTQGIADASNSGIWLAVLSGAVTSGMGYALWYSVLPKLPAAVAAVAQLTVPVIAMAGGMVLLSEALTWQFVVAAVLVLGGVVVSVQRPRR